MVSAQLGKNRRHYLPWMRPVPVSWAPPAENTSTLCTSGCPRSKSSLFSVFFLSPSLPSPPPSHALQTPQTKTNKHSIWGRREGLRCFFHLPNFQGPNHIPADDIGANMKSHRKSDRMILLLTATTSVLWNGSQNPAASVEPRLNNRN